METITVGLCRGRHDLPVDEYIFDKIERPNDFPELKRHILAFLTERVGIDPNACGQGINQNDYTDIQIFRGKWKLRVYVTGLSQASNALVSVCLRNGVDLTLLHYDKETDSYVEDPA